ncbi:MAG: ComF family protein [Rhodospirillaceae bacterium]|nr:ComF family protein [Rhodospirillales bacterium]
MGKELMTAWARLMRVAVDAVLPPLCLCCGALVSEPGALCPMCWEKVGFLSAPQCDACGHPFEFDPGEIGGHALCAPCLNKAPPWRHARAVFRYDDQSKPLVLRFKHSDRLEGAPAFARWMARAGAELLTGTDVIVPVPLHRFRLLSRRYNQAALLALALGKVAGLAVAPDLLVRSRMTLSQGHMNREERRVNVRGAFAVRPRQLPQIRGKAVLLIDDVMTTGATVGECASVLMDAGAAAVDVLTLGRVVFGE